MRRGTKKQSSGKPLHPLDVLLQEMPGESKSMLAMLAQRNIEKARGKEPGWFVATVKCKIEKKRYRPPDSKRDGQTFSQILQRTGVLKRFLSRSLQEEIEKWLLLRDIFQEDRKNKTEGRSFEGFPAQFHRSMMTALLKHLEEIQKIARKYGSGKGIRNYHSSVRREFVRQATVLIFHSRGPVWPDLLGETKLGFSPRDEEVSIRARIFCLLKTKLQKPKSERLGISDQFLKQLTELLLTKAIADSPPTGDRTRYAVNSRTSPGNNLEKSQKS